VAVFDGAPAGFSVAAVKVCRPAPGASATDTGAPLVLTVVALPPSSCHTTADVFVGAAGLTVMLPEAFGSVVHAPDGNAVEPTDGACTRAPVVSTVKTCQPDHGPTSRPSSACARHS
jgi:hypothetical protein